MAKDPKEKDQAKEEAEEGTKPKKKGSKKVLLIILGAVLVLGLAGGGAAWFFLMQEPPAKDAKAKEETKTKEPPMFAALEPFTVNVKAAEGGTENYLQIAIELKVAEKSVVDKVKLHMPEIRNGILLLLTSKNVEELKTVEGKQKLAGDIQAAANKPLGLPGGKGVTGVFFTSFVIQ